MEEKDNFIDVDEVFKHEWKPRVLSVYESMPKEKQDAIFKWAKEIGASIVYILDETE